MQGEKCCVSMISLVQHLNHPLNIKFIADDSLAVEKEMVLIWILSFLIQSFVYLIDSGSFSQKFVADQNINVIG